MKMLTYRMAVSDALPFNLDNLKSRIGVDGDAEDDALMILGKTAAREIEQFAEIALLTQTIRVTAFDPNREAYFNLPVRPVFGNPALTVIVDGAAVTDFELTSGVLSSIRWHASYYDLYPDRISVEYTAGFGSSAADIPQDLAQTIMDHAVRRYGNRSPIDARTPSTSPRATCVGARAAEMMP